MRSAFIFFSALTVAFSIAAASAEAQEATKEDFPTPRPGH